MKKLSSLTAFAASALLLAGCANMVLVDANPGPRAQYFDGDFEFATRNGAIRTIVVGNPVGGDKASFERQVRAYMKNNFFGPPVEFVEANSRRTDSRYYVVVAFNVPGATSNDDLCKKVGDTPTGTNGNRKVNMAFCIEKSLKSGISGRAPQVASADAPAFRELVVETTRSLIPDQDELDVGDAEQRP